MGVLNQALTPLHAVRAKLKFSRLNNEAAILAGFGEEGFWFLKLYRMIFVESVIL